MVIKELSGKRASIGGQGFSLVELLVVVAILGILSIAVGVNINSAKTKLKTFVFNTKTRFNQARFEAIKRSRDVYLEFHLNMDDVGYSKTAPPDNGYTIWVDEDGCGEYDVAFGDSIIAEVDFDLLSGGGAGPKIYCSTCASDGPGNDGPGASKTIGDGVSAGGERFKFSPNGDSGNGGTAYFYFPQGNKVLSGPFAVIVNTVGRIRIDEWKSVGYGWEVDT
jgi:prepilin-type N-terminal cleavage/methylation domain-containing protein